MRCRLVVLARRQAKAANCRQAGSFEPGSNAQRESDLSRRVPEDHIEEGAMMEYARDIWLRNRRGEGRRVLFTTALILATTAVDGIAKSYGEAKNSGASVSIELKNNSNRERQTKGQLERLLAFYDLRKYTFTRAVIIDEKSIPHNHPESSGSHLCTVTDVVPFAKRSLRRNYP
jgi:hypothetical protein